MNTKMKKVVAGAVLGTFAFGVASPAFAAPTDYERTTRSVIEESLLPEDTQIVSTSVAYEVNPVTGETEKVFVMETVTLVEDTNGNVIEERGKGKVALEVIKRVILENWDDIPLLRDYLELKEILFYWLDYFFDICDTVEEVLENAITAAFPNAPSWAVAVAVEAIMFLLPV